MHSADSKTLLVETVETRAVAIDGGSMALELGILLELDGRTNKTRRRDRRTVVLRASQLGPLLAEIAWHGSAGQREFATELEAALRAGHDRLLREGAPS